MSVYRTTGHLVTFSDRLGLFDSDILSESRVSLIPGLGGVRDVALSTISHEQTRSNRAFCVLVRQGHETASYNTLSMQNML